MTPTPEDTIALASYVLQSNSECEYYYDLSWREDINPFSLIYVVALRVTGRSDECIFSEFIMNLSEIYNDADVYSGPPMEDVIAWAKESLPGVEDHWSIIKEHLPKQYENHQKNADYLVEM